MVKQLGGKKNYTHLTMNLTEISTNLIKSHV